MSKGEGKLIAIKFTEKLIGDVSGLTPSPIGGQGYKPIRGAAITTNGTIYSGTIANLVDNDTATYLWTGATFWLQFQLPTAQVKTGFRWYIGHGSYYPTAFTVSASNDGVNYTTLGTFSGTGTIGWQEYTFINATAYLYYKITVTSSNQTNYCFIYEIQFREAIGNEKAFSVTGQEYNYVPEGDLSAKSYSVEKVSAHPTEANTILLSIPQGSQFENVYGDITVAYDGSGNLIGLGGPVLAFSVTFTPADLIPKPDQNAIGHIEVVSITTTGSLIRVYYTDTKAEEHIEVTGITATGALTHVNDI